MSRRFEYKTRKEFLGRIESLKKEGVPRERIGIHTPCHVPETEEILGGRPGLLRVFALGGGLSGVLGGFALPIFTVFSWPIITGGKPIVSIPPFLIIAYLLTILFGSMAAFAGFLLLSRLPSRKGMSEGEIFSDLFVIIVEKEEAE